MHIVLLESLSIRPEVLEGYVEPLRRMGHTFTAFARTDDIHTQIQQARDADILVLANMPLRGEVIRQCPHLQYIDIAFTGVDHVDLEAAKACGIKVSNASGYSNESVAEWTLGMMLSLLRNVPQVDRRCRAGKTKDGLVGGELFGKTVGIVGTGAIGSRTAQLCRAFGCKIVAYNGFSHKQSTDEITYLPLEEMLLQSDIVVLHCPLTEQSRGLIDAHALSCMKQSAYLINAARGPVVDTQALSCALNEGRIAGAAIDVFEVEPPLALDHPLLHAQNAIVTPHIAFATRESMEARAQIVFDNIDRFLAGRQANIIL